MSLKLARQLCSHFAQSRGRNLLVHLLHVEAEGFGHGCEVYALCTALVTLTSSFRLNSRKSKHCSTKIGGTYSKFRLQPENLLIVQVQQMVKTMELEKYSAKKAKAPSLDFSR